MNSDKEPATDIELEARLAFASALGAVQDVAKTQTADTGKYTYKYADLGAVLDECKRVCQMFGLAVSQVPTVYNDQFAVMTTLFHKSGGTVDFAPLMMRMPNDPQALGSALTYARRYALLSIFGIAVEDDDGHTATQQARNQQAIKARTGAEARIRGTLAALEPVQRANVQGAFKLQFGCGLSDLPVSKHAEALEWLDNYLKVEDELDAEFVTQGSKDDLDAAETP